MADKHPYMSGSAGLIQAVNQLRKSFPAQISAETLKKLGIAPNNETYVINILRFIGVIDAEGKKTSKASEIFSKHDDAEFQKGFSELVEASYSDLFSLHGKDAWALPSNKLISFFRGADHTSAIVGQRQAGTFLTLAGLAGHINAPENKTTTGTKKSSAKATVPAKLKSAKDKAQDTAPQPPLPISKSRDMGLTVRIEINLPAAADQETYDRIFKSIKENLLNV